MSFGPNLPPDLLCAAVVCVPELLLSCRCQAVLSGLLGAIPVTSCGVNPLEDSYQLHVMFTFSLQPFHSHLTLAPPQRPILSGALKCLTYLSWAFPQPQELVGLVRVKVSLKGHLLQYLFKCHNKMLYMFTFIPTILVHNEVLLLHNNKITLQKHWIKPNWWIFPISSRNLLLADRHRQSGRLSLSICWQLTKRAPQPPTETAHY